MLIGSTVGRAATGNWLDSFIRLAYLSGVLPGRDIVIHPPEQAITDYGQIAAYGIMSTPGLVIDGKVVSYGRIPTAGDIALWLSE